jgi:putative AlgH/UPF0301 family transcriptional regulator
VASNPTLTITPTPSGSAPTDRQGILFIVEGPVRPNSAIVITTDDDVVHAKSPAFGMKNRVVKTSEVVDITSTATGGTFYLYGDDGTTDFPQTPDLDHDATAADVQAAIRSLWGQQSVVATGGPLGTEAVRVTFADRLREQAITVAVNDDAATGGSVTVAEITAGGAESSVLGGPYTFGPIFLPHADYTADVLAVEADADLGVNIGDSMLSAATEFTVYEYSD